MLPDNKAIYDANWEQWSDQKIYGPGSRWLRWLVKRNVSHVDSSEVGAVLDVGCGQGSLTAMLAALLPSAQVSGIDFSDTGIQVASRLYAFPNLSFEVDADSNHLDRSQYDLVTCFEVLEHVTNWTALLQRICNASNRYVMLSFPTGRMRSFEVAIGHVRNFQRGQVEEFMKRTGFAPVNLFYAGFPFYSPLYRDFQELINAGRSSISDFATGQFGTSQKVVSATIYFCLRHLSLSRIGDQFCGLFERSGG